jgi:hypothetical protein
MRAQRHWGVRFARDDLQGQDGVWWKAVVLFNPHDSEVPFTLPKRDGTDTWTVAVDTATTDAEPAFSSRRKGADHDAALAPANALKWRLQWLK